MTITQASLFQSPPRDTSLRVGPAGWNYRDWEGVAYPASLGRSFDPLAFLADYCDTIEINSCFYAPPRGKDVASWMGRVRNNPRFKFTAKAWQRLSHEARDESESLLSGNCDEVRRSMTPLMEAGIRGALLIQFPWSFRCSPENLEHLRRLFCFLRGFPLVVEVRHGSWDRQPFYDFLRENGVAFCNVDQPLVGNSMKPGAQVTARLGYFRLHGRNYKDWFREGAGREARYDYLYSKEEIYPLAQQIQRVRAAAEETYAITNNHFRAQALVNAIEIMEELDAERPAIPPLLAASYPDRFESRRCR